MGLLRRTGKRAFRCFFATDIHGSDRCFRKFLAAAAVYEADALVLGGDIAGKAIVPVAATDRGYRFSLSGEEHEVPAGELDAALSRINFAGLYGVVCTREEVERLRSDPERRREVFEETITRQVEGWCRLAAERLPEGVRCIITPGNDDPRSIDAVLKAAERIECPELEVVEFGPALLASMGNTNVTPWHTEREYEEEELSAQVGAMLERSSNDHPLVLNFHCPPYGSGLDTVTKLDDDLRPVIAHGAPVEVPAGSTAVRDAILAYHPTVGLHGHIHEAHGVHRVGQTVCINPGSEYSSGILRGAIVDLDAKGRCVEHLLTAG